MILLHLIICSCVFVLDLGCNCLFLKWYIPILKALTHSLCLLQLSLFQDQSSTWNTNRRTKWRRQRVRPACSCLSSSTRNGTHPRGTTKSPAIQQITEKIIHFGRRKRTTDRQGAVLFEHSATWFAPRWQNNQNRRVSYCFVDCIYNEMKACRNENWDNIISKSLNNNPVFFFTSFYIEKIWKLSRFRNLAPLFIICYSPLALLSSPLFISLSDNSN